MPVVLPRLVKIRTKDLMPQNTIHFSFDNAENDNVNTTEQIKKNNINIACQMLRAGQQAIVHSNDSIKMIFRCDDLNNVTLNVLDRSQNLLYSARIEKSGINVIKNEINAENLCFLKFIQKQLCPLSKQVQAASNSIQNGFVPGSNDFLGTEFCPLNDMFLKTNASSLSFAFDMLKSPLNRSCKKKYELYTFTHAATAVQLASLFAVGAQSKKKCIFNVNQLTSFQPSQALLNAIAECPATSEVSILSKCEDGNARRHNVYVKCASCDSLVGRLAQEECLALNASMQSPIFIVNGIQDGTAAFIFHDQNNRPLAHLNACTKSFFFV